MSRESVAADHGDAPFVSVVVPTTNRSGTLADCVGSLVVQDYPASMFEIVLVENGSTERGLAQPRELATPAVAPEVRVLSLRRRDANAARNAGVRAARGDLICFVDDDVVAPPGWLAALTAGVSRHPGAGCLGGAIRARFEASIPRNCPAHGVQGTEFDRGDCEVEVAAVWGPNLVVPRRSFERIGLFREGLALEQEWEWQQRLIASGGKIVYLPDAWLWHRQFDSDLRLSRQLSEHFRRGFTRGRLSTPEPAPKLAREMARELAHGIGAPCTRGLTEAARRMGFLAARFVTRADASRA
jgi:glycosyltransferase involved in cell wall biosynthesis